MLSDFPITSKTLDVLRDLAGASKLAALEQRFEKAVAEWGRALRQIRFGQTNGLLVDIETAEVINRVAACFEICLRTLREMEHSALRTQYILHLARRVADGGNARSTPASDGNVIPMYAPDIGGRVDEGILKDLARRFEATSASLASELDELEAFIGQLVERVPSSI